MKRKEKRRWELEEPKEEIIPTLKEKIELGLSDEQWILICYLKYKNSQCFRESSGHRLCDLCPKLGKIKIDEKLANDIKILAKKIGRRLTRHRSKRPYYRR